MPNSYFNFKQFSIQQQNNGMKVSTDGCIFGAWVANEINIKNTPNKNLLDIGSGTGLLSLMISQKNNLNITAIEIDNHGFEELKINVENSPWASQITCLNNDCKTYQFNQIFDVIVCNPPFFVDSLQSPYIQKNKAKHTIYLHWQDVFKIAQQYLSKQGYFYLLSPAINHIEIKNVGLKWGFNLIQEISIFSNKKKPALRTMFEFSKIKGDTIYTNFYIKNEQNEYSKDMEMILNDYYL